MSLSSRHRKSAKNPPRSWRVTIMRKRGQFLGYVQATDREAAEAAAVDVFKLNDEQRKRLMVRERGY